jgi:hypothetical protein
MRRLVRPMSGKSLSWAQPGGFGIVALDPLANAFKVLGGWQRPADLHQG